MLRTPSRVACRQRLLLTGAITLALVLSGTLTGCGGAKERKAGPSAAVAECRARWHDLAQSIVGMDEDGDPSALAPRWTTILATVDYYENAATATRCAEAIDNQRTAISALRQLTEKLRPYDMAYQRTAMSASVDLYLHDPLPEPVRGDAGQPVAPPAKKLVTTAVEVLDRYAARANADLAPGWAQTLSVDLDPDAVVKAIQDLDLLAQDSSAWQRCQAGLQILAAAQQAQRTR